MDETEFSKRRNELARVTASEGRSPIRVAPDLSSADFPVEIGEGGVPFRTCYEWAGDRYERFVSLRGGGTTPQDRRGR